MGGVPSCCASCKCCSCLLDSYLHIYIREITDCSLKGDMNLARSIDAYLRIKYDGYRQESKILKNETASMSFKEPLILENASPPNENDLRASGDEYKLVIELWDADTVTGDDYKARAVVTVPTGYGDTIGETTVDLLDKDNEVCGKLTVDQMHFIKQKLKRYGGYVDYVCMLMAGYWEYVYTEQ